MELEQIEELIEPLKAIFKDQDKMHKRDKEGSVPDYNPIYRQSVEMCEEVCVHMEQKKFPEKLFRNKAPHEDPKEFEYRKLIYQPVTVPYMHRALSTINRIWSESNYTVTGWEKSEGNTFDIQPEEYFTKKYPSHKSIFSFFKSYVTKAKLKDPNAVLAIRPKIKFDEEGLPITEQSELLECTAVIYDCYQVVDFKENEYCLIELNEKSWVEYGNGKVKEGRIFELYDNNFIWRITQVGKKIDYIFDIQVYYTHNLGYIPVQKLKGNPVKVDEDVLYESYLMPAIPNLNIAICTHSTLDMSIYSHAFPQRWEYVDPCNAEGCDNGYIYTRDLQGEGEKKMTCPSCQGTGKGTKHSPLGVYQLQLPGRLDPDALNNVNVPPAGYIAPDTAILQFAYDKLRNDIVDAFTFVNIDVSNTTVQPTEKKPALSKKIDREELFSFLLLISSELYDLLDFSIDTIGKIRYGLNFEKPTITKPVDFSIRSNDELIQEMVDAKAAMVPDIIIQKQLKEYCLSRFNTEKEVTQFLDIVFKVDRLITLTQQDIVLQKNTGSVLTWEVILHTSIYTFLEQLMIEKEGFLEIDYVQQKTLLEDKAKAKESEIKAASPAPTVDKILSIANAQGNNSAQNAAA
jgi:hypothetical protein